MQLQYYTWLIWHRFWLILIGVVLCTGATFAISSHATPTYEASSLIQVTAPTSSNGNDVFSNQALAVSDALLVTSDNVLRTAAKSIPGVTFAQLQQAVSASPADNTQLIQVRGDATNPDLAATITNTVAQTFIQVQVKTETARLQGTADQLSQQLATAKANVDAAQGELTLLQHSNGSTTQIDQQTNVLTAYQLNYNSLLTSYNDIQLQKVTMARSLTIVQPASPPTQPIGSRTLLNTGIAAAMSLLLMVVLILLLDWIDATIKTPEDVAQLALLEPLGSIPLRTNETQLPSELLLNDNQLERAFAIINTNFNALNTGQRSLMVTSLHPRTGTTTVATHLALALAQSGTHVLLVDAHLRQPELHTLFHVPNMRGLATCQADAQVLQKQPDQVYNWLSQWATNEPNLWLLPAGSIVGNSTAILRSRELRKLVSWLLQDIPADHKSNSPVDIIIFDTPALEEEADTVTLAPLCDSSILVVEAGKERKETLKKAQATLQRLGAPIVGVVVNRQKASHRSYLYVNQPQQGMFPNEALSSSSVTEVKYPLLKMQTLSVRAIPKLPAPRPVRQEQENIPGPRVNQENIPNKRVSIVEQSTMMIEAAKEVKPPSNGSAPAFKPLTRKFVPARDKEQGGN